MEQTEYQYEQVRDREMYPTCFHAENNSFITHFHSAIELMFVHEGEIQVIIDGKTLIVPKDRLIVVPCYSIHSFSTPVYSRETVLIIPLNYMDSCEAVFRNKTFAEYLLSDPERTARIKQLITKIADEKCNSILLRGMIYEILGHIIDELPMKDAPQGEARGKLHGILSYLQENYTQPLSLETTAARFGYSKSRFSHLFNEMVGCSLPHYLNMLRAKHAIRLVRDSGYSMLDAAMAAGYESMRSFYRAFHRIYNCTPSEYLERK